MPIDPGVLQQLMALGTMPSRRAGAQRLGQGTAIDYSRGSGLSQLVASLLNAGGQAIGGAQEGMLDREQTRGRTSLMDLLGKTPDLNAPDAQAQLGAQRQGGLAAMLSGDPIAGQVGRETMGEATHGADVLRGMPMAALQRQHVQQQIDAGGPRPALGGKTLQDFTALAGAEKLDQYAPNPMTGELYNKHTGQTKKGSGSAPALLSPEALDMNAQNFIQSGTLPSVGMGAAGAAVRRQIINRAAEMNGGANIAVNKASYKADTGSLATLQKSADSIESFENTGLKNLDAFIKTASSVIDTGSPLFNKPLRTLDLRILGSDKQTRFNTARQVAVQEIGKVLGGAVQGGAITDSQRHEVEGLISGDASLAQIKAAAEVLKQDMANRKQAVHEQLNAIKGRISGKPQEAPAAPAAAPSGVRKFTRGPDGKLVEVQ